MKFGFVKTAVFSQKISVCDVSENVNIIKKAIIDAEKQGVELISFPYLSLTGASAGDSFFTDTLINGAVSGLIDIKKFTLGKKIVVAVSLPFKLDGRLYLTVAIVFDGKILAIVPKKMILSTAIDEARYFSPYTSENKIIELDGEEVVFGNDVIFKDKSNKNFTFGVLIGDEATSFFSNAGKLCANGVTILLNPSVAEQIVGNFTNIKETLKSTSRQLSACILSCFSAFGESTTDCVYGGKSYIFEKGKALKESELFNEELLIEEIDCEYLNYKREKQYNNVTESKMTTIYFDTESDLDVSRKFSKTPFVPVGENEKRERAEFILSIQAEALRKRIEHTHANSLVIGLSGGLDSTLAILVAERSIRLANKSPKDVLAITMPCFGTTSRTLDNSIKLAKALGVKLKKVDISKSVKRHLKDISHDLSTKDVTFENAQARERTQVLMDSANMCGGLVVGTGDLSEVALGWSTYNGDHMSMYGVNCSIPKTLVRHLVEYVALTSKPKLKSILLDILDTPVSPELLPPEDGKIAQKTEDIVGPYVLHDYFLYGFIKKGWSPRKIYELAKITFNGEFNSDEILKWLKMFVRRFFTQQFKRSCVPDGVKVGAVALSPRGGFMLPSDAVYKLYLDELENL